MISRLLDWLAGDTVVSRFTLGCLLLCAAGSIVLFVAGSVVIGLALTAAAFFVGAMTSRALLRRTS